MRIHLRLEVVLAALLVGSAAAAAEPRGPAPDEAAVQDALAEPADPDDEADIRADNDPNDVGQQALEATEGESPNAGQPTPAGAALPGVDPGGE